MLRVNNLIGFGAGLPPVVSVVAAASNAGGTDTTVSNVNFGRPHPNRLIVVAVVARAGGTATFEYQAASDEINGASATTHVAVNTGLGGTECLAAIFSAAVPTGGTGSFRVVFSRSASFDYAVFRLITASGSTTATSSDEDSPTNNGADLSLNTATGDVLIACATAASGTWSVTGVANVAFEDGSAWIGWERVASGAAPRTVDIDTTATSEALAGVAASFIMS